MSVPEASTTRQRTNVLSDEKLTSQTDNPDSLSGHTKNLKRNKPDVKPPFYNVSMNRFLTYLALGLLTISAFYTWRVTVWASSAGGYWNLMTGHRSSAASVAASSAASFANRAASSAISVKQNSKTSVGSASATGGPAQGGNDVQLQIYNLANALGIKPAELSNAIRPLIDPSTPNPADAATQEVELLKAQLHAQEGTAANAAAAEPSHGSIMGVVAEALLD